MLTPLAVLRFRQCTKIWGRYMRRHFRQCTGSALVQGFKADSLLLQHARKGFSNQKTRRSCIWNVYRALSANKMGSFSLPFRRAFRASSRDQCLLLHQAPRSPSCDHRLAYSNENFGEVFGIRLQLCLHLRTSASRFFVFSEECNGIELNHCRSGNGLSVNS